MALGEIRNFVDVDGRIGTGGQPSERQLMEIADAGYRHVVNLGLLDPKYCLEDEAGAVRALGLAYDHIPVTFDAPRTNDFLRFVDVMDRARSQKVFVHCAMNYRVSSFVSLYGQMRFGWSSARADAHLQRVWIPDAVWNTFIDRCRRLFDVHVRPAAADDGALVTSILHEAAAWLEGTGQSMWQQDELDPARTADDVRAGMFHVAQIAGQPAGVARVQFDDPQFWPDVPPAESVFVHRLAVRRGAAGREVATALLAAARAIAVDRGRAFLRLDCEASRPRLRNVYERFGFRHHSDRQVGPYFVSRYEIDLRLSPTST